MDSHRPNLAMLAGMRVRRVVVGAAIIAAGTLALAQQVDVSALGPQVGDRVSDFRLSDQQGREWTIADAAGPEGTMLVFFRSADW